MLLYFFIDIVLARKRRRNYSLNCLYLMRFTINHYLYILKFKLVLLKLLSNA